MGLYKVGPNLAPAGGNRLMAGETVTIKDEDLGPYAHAIAAGYLVPVSDDDTPTANVEDVTSSGASQRAAAGRAVTAPPDEDPPDEDPNDAVLPTVGSETDDDTTSVANAD